MKKKCVRISTVFRHCVRAFLLCSSTFCVHFYYSSTVFQHWLRAFPLLREAFWIVLDCIPALLACISIAFLSCSSTFLRAHFYGIPALGACIPTNLQHSLHAFLLHFYCISPALPACISTMIQHFSVCITWVDRTMLQHFFCVYFHCDPTLFLCVYFYCAPAFFVHVFLRCFSSDTLPTLVLMLFMFSNSNPRSGVERA